MRKDEFPIIDKYVVQEINAVLDKIRAEIKQLPYQSIFGKVSSYSLLDAVIEIIDKYKAESEPQESEEV
jgi:hypothetical protein